MEIILSLVQKLFLNKLMRDLVGIGGGEYRSVQKKRRVEGGEWRVEGEEVWSVQESGSEKI